MFPKTSKKLETFLWKFQEIKTEVWFFLDTSGSNANMADLFFGAAESLPADRYNIRLFCFDTEVYETYLETRAIYGSMGGTKFSILEEKILREEKYPDAVFVFTDGYGEPIELRKPKRWHWFLTPNGVTNSIPRKCHIHYLVDE